ncbi:MAG: glucose-1-phosphate adenylyltransferase [Acidobacteria bacterium]|jgi:glucose-1-phosphate adenylyltransferase|nr:glucose-1-phosphate adenylyltransferase [Acidobacteriota bacterium]
MNKIKVLALILAGGKGGRLGILTDEKAKPVVPFGGAYRLIDFALSNCVHSRIADVWVVEQYQLHSLNEHLSNGRPWDLDRTRGGLLVLPPFENETAKDGFAQGNADAIYRHLDFIENFALDVLLVLSADHVYKMDFRDAVQTHLEKKASVTIVTTKLPEGEPSASRFGVVKANKNGRITQFNYKPEKPESDLITTEIFVYDAKILIETLKKLKKENGQLKDYGDELLPRLVEKGQAFEHRLDGYWRDVGTIESYYGAQMDLLDEKTKIFFDDERWQVFTLAEQRIPAFVSSKATVKNCLVAGGAKVYGSANRSILSSGVSVETGATVIDSIVLPNAIIERGANLKRTIVDTDVRVTKERAKKLAAMQKMNKNGIFIVGKRKIQDADEIEK